MRILRSTHSVNPAAGGPIESIKQSSAVLAKWGHTVEIVCLDAPNEQWVQECPVPVHALGPGRGSYGYASGFTPWITDRRTNYDVVIVQGLWQYSSFGVWRALHGTSTPYFVFTHGMLDPWFKRTYPLKHIKKLLYWRWGEYRVLRDAAAVLFTSEEERRLARESFSRYQCREQVVNYGTAAPACDLAAAREHFFTRFPHLRGKRLLLFLGRVAEKKGCDLLIKAFAEARRAEDESLHLVIAGPPSNEAYLAHLQDIARESLGGDGAETALTFTGMLAGEAKWGAFSAAEAFVLPSHQENFGIAVVEAMACGTPVLISNQVNIWREITEDGAGFADEDNLAGTARLLRKWFQAPEDERARMRENARRSFGRRFEITQATESLLRVLKTAVKAE